MSETPLFHELDALLRDVVGVTKPTTRRAMARRIAGDLRRSQQKRIGQQKNPDGTAFEARKKKTLGTQGGISFIRDGEVRRLRNWRHSKGRYGDRMITGFDEEKGGIRSFLRADIERYLSIDLARKTTAKTSKDPMFRKLRAARFLRADAYPDAVVVGFKGSAAKIARVHQYGLTDQVAHRASAKYPARQLLGLTEQDIESIADAVFSALEGATQ
ncbi:phage tail protein [Rouxiella silvae]|uniref:Phage tail protein n=1 Tax=Rouxiella silvae TaxID=1646373 RepID=A0ABX3U219_9GAMM|nr:phage virion morphogenesis protein [Rouxiella silvae]ORJ21586.1 phage tail protein [Rouxiella silvae]